MLNELRNQGRIVENEYKKTTQNWKGDKPEFESLIGLTGKDASVLTGPTGSQHAVDKFIWLDEGTRIRWAVMSSDWRSKTKPGSFRTGRGNGRVIIAGRRAMTNRNIAPRPGIKARNWTSTLQKRRKRPFTKAMVTAARISAETIYV